VHLVVQVDETGPLQICVLFLSSRSRRIDASDLSLERLRFSRVDVATDRESGRPESGREVPVYYLYFEYYILILYCWGGVPIETSGTFCPIDYDSVATVGPVE